MKIVRIFADRLFAFHYENEANNELRRLLLLWNDPSYLYGFVNQHIADAPKSQSVSELINLLIDNANEIDSLLIKITSDSKRKLEEFFKPLNNQEYHITELSKQKGRNNYLRLYAIRIDENCFVITGGAIKFHYLNKDRPHTDIEMAKINKCRDYLKSNSIIDSDSFFEFLIEQP